MKVSLVGLGNAGQNIHLPALDGLDGVQVVGGFDVVESSRAAAAQRFSIPVFDNFDTMLEQAKPELIIIGTPPDSHADYCLRSVAAGANVICEKPFASSLAEADMIIQAAEKAGRRIALNHEFREMEIFRALLGQVGRPEVGDLSFVQVWQLMDLPPWKEPGWRGQMLQRTLYEAGVHLVDYVMALFGEKPTAVTAVTSTCGVRESESDAVALVTLEFPGGRLANIIQNRLCRGETQYFEVRAEGTNASLRASFGGRARVTAGLHRSTKPHFRIDYGISGIAWREVGNHRTFLARNPKDPTTTATRDLFRSTIEAFDKGTKPPASAQDGRDILQVIAACYHSADIGQRVEINEETSRKLADVKMGAVPAS